MKLTPNFDDSEFRCPCGCGGNKINIKLVERLQILRNKIGKPINITSGYRCPTHSLRVGGTYSDAHTRGFAADIYVNGMKPIEIARIAEDLGFGGIGLMSNALHLDIRDENGTHGVDYPNSHWWGNEVTGENWIKSFKNYKG